MPVSQKRGRGLGTFGSFESTGFPAHALVVLIHDEWLRAIGAANHQFALLKKKHPGLKGRLVLSLPGGQADLGISAVQMLVECPALVVDDRIKSLALELLDHKEKLETGLQNLSSPESDAELKAKAKAVGKLWDDFRSQFGLEMAALADQLQIPIWAAREHLKSLPPAKQLELVSRELLVKQAELEKAEADFTEAGRQKRAELDELKKQLDRLGTRLRFVGHSQVELRFHELNYELIWKLQIDELVDRRLTPQTKASIRIVLGTLEHFTCPNQQEQPK